ncbi:MAG: hypothetical protein Kow0069_37060 [Promethearchaeota archaeon]
MSQAPPKVRVIAKRKHLPSGEPSPLFEALQEVASVELVAEEDVFWKAGSKVRPCSLVFCASSGRLALAHVSAAEAQGIKCINPAPALRVCRHVGWRAVLLSSAGVLVPEVSGVRGVGAARENGGRDLEAQNRLLRRRVKQFKRSIKPDAEYRTWLLGDSMYSYEVVVRGANGPKLEPAASKPLEETARRAGSALGLRTAAFKFLSQDENYYLVGLSATPTFNDFPEGPGTVAEWLVSEAVD